MIAGAVIGTAVIVAAAAAGLAVSQRGTIPARTTVAGVEVGGMSVDEATEAILPATQSATARPIRLIGPQGSVRVSGRELGARPLVEDALEAATASGWGDRLVRRLGFGEERTIPLTYRLGPVRAAELANRLDEEFGDEPKNADLKIGTAGSSVTVTVPAPGVVVDRGALRRGLATLPGELGVPLVTRPPLVGIDEARRAQARVRRLLDGPREVRYRDTGAVLPFRHSRHCSRPSPSPGSC